MNGNDSYITCPFNEAHQILRAQFQTHLITCITNYPNQLQHVCPFDATHQLVPEEFEHHLTVCPSKGNVQYYQNILGPEQTHDV
uniref:gametocyte-specific factor 1-like n=1 Tax=Osmia lignaria TaxID=473952 RepID=UPI0014782E4D|nr:gametocyte-specific factor 1-like [Osmia lignaria]XP_034177034.1 gametocyte-specific factor 1-like [Osmia lignaria]XP_034177035.1 gametocyte-specific factor 1-like [Osmia lignaria]XP_034177036.1 gametocyte-specific factor 1-like [Osmia lignaria]